MEQEILRNSKIAIAGMGGVGGSHLQTLARLGVGNFNIADFDVFELHNFNRQAGATIHTLNKPKVQVLEESALAINPNARIKTYPEGLTDANMEEFFQGVNVYVDGLDLYAMDFREKALAHCYQKGIPAITVAPVGMGAALLHFTPGKMSAQQYFGIDSSQPFDEKIMRVVLGLTPSFAHLRSVVDRTYFDPTNKRAPSTPMGCMLASGFAVAEVLKVILNRGKIRSVPWSLHFDAYSEVFKKSYTIWGARNPLFKFKLSIFKKLLQEAHKRSTKT